MTTEKHVSTFELDVYFASPSDGSEVARHVGSCATCTAYLDALRALDEDGVGLRALGAQASPRRPGAPRRRFVAPAAGFLAIAAALMLYVRSRPADDAAYVGVKGAPAVEVLVRSAGRTRVWDGLSPVHAGDALAVQLVCEHLEHVTVTTEDQTGPVRLWEGACPKAPAALPFTLVVDDQPGRERFAVVLGRAPMNEEGLRDALRANLRSRDVWVTAIELPKEVQR